MKLATLEIELLANLAKFQDTMNKASKTADVAMRNIEKSANLAQKALGGLGAAISFQAISKLVDDYKKFDSQLKLATKSLEEYGQAYENVIRIGRTAQSDIGAIGVLYARLNNNLRDFNVTQNEVANVTETISLALRVNNATVQETNSVMLQLSQSFGSGRLNGQEFLAVTEGAPNLMRQLAKSLNVPYGALKDLSSQGKITREDLLRAWTDPEYLAALRNNVKEVGTISSAITVATNNLKQFVGEKDKAAGASRALSQGIIFLSDNINLLVNVALAAAVVQLIKWTQGIYASVAAMRVKSAETVIAAKVELSLAQAAYASGAAVNTNNKALAGNAAATTLATSNTARLIAAQTALARATSFTAKAWTGLNTVFNLLGGTVGVVVAALTGLYFWFEKIFNDRKIAQYGTAIDGIRERLKQTQELAKAGISADDPFSQEKMNIKQLEKARDALFFKMQNQQKLLKDKSIFAPSQNDLKQTAAEYVQAVKDIESAQKELQFNTDLQNDKLKNSAKLVADAADAQDKNVKKTKELTDAEKAYQQILENRASADQEISDLKEITKLLKQGYELEEARFRVASIRQGLLPEQIEALLKEKEIQEDIAEEENARRERLQIWIKEQIDAQEEIKKATEKRLQAEQKRADENFEAAKKAHEEANKEIEQANDRLYRNLSRSITDSIVRGFEEGLSFIDNFKRAITTAFKSFFVNIGVNFFQKGLEGIFGNVTKGVFGTIASAFSGSALAGEGVATAGLLDQAKSVFDVITKGFDGANAALQSSIEGFGALLSNGKGGILDAVGGAIGQYSSVISGALPFAGAAIKLLQGDFKGAAFQGGGAALGSIIAGPVGGAIGAALGSLAGGLFGGEKKLPRYYTGVSSRFIDGQFIAGRGKTGADSQGMIKGVEGSLNNLNRAFSEQLGGLFQAAGINQNIGTNSLIYQKNNTLGRFDYGFGGRRFKTMIEGDSDVNATFKRLIEMTLGETLVKAIQSSALPKGIKNLFSGLTNSKAVSQTVQASIKLLNANVQLKDQFNLTANNAAVMAKEVGLSGSSLVKFVDKLTATSNSLVTPAQQILAVRDALSSQLGRALPETIQSFDEILKSFNTATKSGRELFYTMFNLRDSFIEFNNAITGIKKGVNDAIFGLLTPQQQQAQNQARLVEEFAKFNLAVPQSAQQMIAIGQSIDYTTEAGLNLALAFPSLVQAFEATQGAVDSLANSLNPERFRTFFDFAVASSYTRQGLPIPAANMPSYDVGTSYVPNTGVAMLHQGEAVLTRSENSAITFNSAKMVTLLGSLVEKVTNLELDIRRTADGTQRTARELEDITSGDIVIQTQAA